MLLNFIGYKAMTHNFCMTCGRIYKFCYGDEIDDIDVILVVNGIGTKETGTAGWELEGFHSEGEVLIIGIVDYKAVVDGLLQALGSITHRHQRACISRSQTFLNASGLCQSLALIVSFDVVDDDSPFALSVDSS